VASGPTAPELILPSEWLPVIWGGEEQFALNQRNNELTAAQLLRL
jgi:hypothetical protein